MPIAAIKDRTAMVITIRAGVQKFLPVFRGRFFEAMVINSYRCQELINCFGEGRSLILRTAPRFLRKLAAAPVGAAAVKVAGASILVIFIHRQRRGSNGYGRGPGVLVPAHKPTCRCASPGQLATPLVTCTA